MADQYMSTLTPEEVDQALRNVAQVDDKVAQAEQAAQQAQQFADSINPANFVQASALVDLIYPVGSIYMSANNVSPQTFLGGSWAKIEGRFLLAADSAHPAGSTGGKESQTVSLQQIPDHYHSISTGDGSGAGYNYPGYAAIVTQNAGESPSNAYACNTGYVAGRNNADQQPLSTMPPYLAVYMWKRTA